MLRRHFILRCLSALAVIVGCSDYDKPRAAAGETPPAKRPDSTHSPADATDAAADSQEPQNKTPDPIRGRVSELLDTGAYVYLLLATEKGDVWAAARKFPVAVGDQVEIAGLMPMYDFKSPTLKRSFKVIQFVGSATVLGSDANAGSAPPKPGSPAGALPEGHPRIDASSPRPKPGPATPPKPGEIEALPGGTTLAQLFDRKNDLRGKTVRFRGRVIKANSRILGRNWLHIQDGTGKPGHNDITVTSKSGYAPPGSLVVIEGTVTLDKDFGAGYAYEVIVEDATVTIEPAKAAPPAPGD